MAIRPGSSWNQPGPGAICARVPIQSLRSRPEQGRAVLRWVPRRPKRCRICDIILVDPVSRSFGSRPLAGCRGQAPVRCRFSPTVCRMRCTVGSGQARPAPPQFPLYDMNGPNGHSTHHADTEGFSNTARDYDRGRGGAMSRRRTATPGGPGTGASAAAKPAFSVDAGSLRRPASRRWPWLFPGALLGAAAGVALGLW